MGHWWQMMLKCRNLGCLKENGDYWCLSEHWKCDIEILVSIESCPAFKMSLLINCEISSKFEVNDNDYSRPVSPTSPVERTRHLWDHRHPFTSPKSGKDTDFGGENKKDLQKDKREISGTKMNLEGWNGPGKGSEGLSVPNHPSTEAPMSHRTLSKVTTLKWKSADLPIQDCCCLCDHIPLWLPWEAGWPPWSGWPWRNPGWDPGEHVGWGPTNMHSIHSTSI